MRKSVSGLRAVSVVGNTEFARQEHIAPVIVSAAMRRLYEVIARAAPTDLSVLIYGETGSGKELVARALHAQSARAHQPFKALNCATLPTHLVESSLFGHERGAFTGADAQAQGIFEQAQHGTVFLDEVGELSAGAQAALLRVLEQKCIIRVGGTREIALDVRIVAATHCDLVSMVGAGRFRMDLLFRLEALSLTVPPLRERREEIRPLAESFLERAHLQWGTAARSIAEPVFAALESYGWPGNVRQLRNTIERASALCSGARLELSDLPEELATLPRKLPVRAPLAAVDDDLPLAERVRRFELSLIREALERTQGNPMQAAYMLGLPKKALARKMRAHGLLGPTRDALAPSVRARPH